jgi:hypothetical protein
MCVTLQETLNEIKLKGKEIEISQIDRTISTHGYTNALSINTLTKTKKQISNKKSSQEIKSEASATLNL